MTQEEKRLRKAYMDDLHARRYVLIEQLQMCRTCEDYMETINQLNLVENKILCFEIRELLHESTKQNSIHTLRGRWDSCEREVHLAKTHR